jgi:hypothetical protein
VKTIVLTFDTDWAPPFVIEKVIQLLQGLSATFFVTDRDAKEVLEGHQNIEIGIHPNFLPGSSHGRNRIEIMNRLMDLVPQARTVRAHNLFQDTTVLDIYVEKKLECDLSLVEYENLSPEPFRYWNGLARLPYNFDDTIALMRREDLRLRTWMGDADPLICNFHPIHLYLNTDRMERYLSLRDQGSLSKMKVDQVQSYINRKNRGVQDLFLSILEMIHLERGIPLIVTDLLKIRPWKPWSRPNPGHLSTYFSPIRSGLEEVARSWS